jgi:hypothetical protein
MPSSWIITRPTADGGKRYHVRYRLGGRESRQRYGGSFPTKTEALARRRYIDGELAALRVPDLAALEREPESAPTLVDAANAWRASRVDVVEQTSNMHRSAFMRIFRVRPELRSRRIDEVTVADVSDLVAALADAATNARRFGRAARRWRRRSTSTASTQTPSATSG